MQSPSKKRSGIVAAIVLLSATALVMTLGNIGFMAFNYIGYRNLMEQRDQLTVYGKQVSTYATQLNAYRSQLIGYRPGMSDPPAAVLH